MNYYYYYYYYYYHCEVCAFVLCFKDILSLALAAWEFILKLCLCPYSVLVLTLPVPDYSQPIPNGN